MKHPRRIVIEPKKYQVLETYKGSFAALKAFQCDVGSTAKINTSELLDPIAKTYYSCVIVPDIAFAFGVLKKRLVFGLSAPTQEDSAALLLNEFLSASNQLHLLPSGVMKSGFLAILDDAKDAHTIVHIARPQLKRDAKILHFRPR